MSFDDYIKNTINKRQEMLNSLVSYVLADTILFVPSKFVDEDVSIKIKKAVNLVNGIINTNFTISDDLNISKNNEKQSILLKEYLAKISFEKFIVIYLMSMELRSVLLSVLVVEKKYNIDEVFNLAFYEELFQQKHWGILDETLKKQNLIKEKLKEMEAFINERSLYKN